MDRDARMAFVLRTITEALCEPGLPPIGGYSVELGPLPGVALRMKVWLAPRSAAFESPIRDVLECPEVLLREDLRRSVRLVVREVQPAEAGPGAAWSRDVAKLGLPREWFG